MRRLLQKAQQVSRVLTGRQAAGRGLTVLPDDVFIVSYPRSGNNWTRFLIGNLIRSDEPVSFVNLEARVPEIYFHSDRQLRRVPGPRVFKSHEAFDPRYANSIYIVRDPRDVAVSNYHHNLRSGNLQDGVSLDEFVPRFIAAEFDSKWGSWRDHVVSWLATRKDQPGFLLVRYEDMKNATADELVRVAAFLTERWNRHISSSPEVLQRVIELSSPERMRALEQEQGRQWLGSLADRNKKSYLAVRAAVAGGWKSALSASSVAAIESAWADVMTSVGYKLVTTTQLANPRQTSRGSSVTAQSATTGSLR
jgi:hypothetical protein